MGVPKTGDHIKVKIKMPNPNQKPPATFKAPSEALKDIDVLCIFKILALYIDFEGAPHLGLWRAPKVPN